MRSIAHSRRRRPATVAAVAMVFGMGPLLAAGVMAPSALAEDAGCEGSPDVPFFVDPAPQPPVATSDGVKNGATHYTLTAQKGVHRFSSAWPAVPSLGYNGAGYLGPTIVTQKGKPVIVTLKNGLPKGQMFPWDKPDDVNNVIVHRHGGLQAAKDDGVPGHEVAVGTTRDYYYPNSQPAAPLWYHDHAMDVTSYRVYEGLAGFMPNTDAIEPSLNLPKGDYAKAYVLQDKTFNAYGSLCYSHNEPEFFGDLPVINGVVAPVQSVDARKYKVTFINGSDSRFMHMTLKLNGPAGTGSVTAPTMTVVGSDEGYLRNPTKVNDLLIAPGERYTVVVNFAGHKGQSWVLANDAAAPYPDGGGAPDNDRTGRLMAFQVGTRSVIDLSSVPPLIVTAENGGTALQLLQARLRTVQAGEIGGMPMLGDKKSLHMFMDKVTETPKLGSTEVWAMRNWSPDTHPFHEHLVSLRLIARWPATFDEVTHLPTWIGPMEPPKAFESGPKDTFVSPKNYITAWVGTYKIGGTSVWHCHLLSHEDTSMMRPLTIGTTAQTGLPWVYTRANLDKLVRQP